MAAQTSAVTAAGKRNSGRTAAGARIRNHAGNPNRSAVSSNAVNQAAGASSGIV